MARAFDYFIILAEMRTGSNFLEEELNEFPGIKCLGEVFNRHFFGRPNTTEMLGMTMKTRELDPLAAIEAIKVASGAINGFRFFHDHDNRVLANCLNDRRCAKVILTRNPVDSYVSRGIVRQTNQWRLGDLKNVKSAKVTFDATEFSNYLAQHQKFRLEVLHALQTSGQAAFYLDYENIPDVKVISGLARFLGVEQNRKGSGKKAKKQNPQPLEEKVVNFDEMKAALASVDYFALNRPTNFEPRRGPAIPKYIAAANSPLLFMPIESGPTQTVTRWLADLDQHTEAELKTGFTQKDLRHWKRMARGHWSFTVVRHPVARLHDAFVRRILLPGPQGFATIRQTLRTTYDLPIPKDAPDKTYDATNHRKAFIAFAKFVKGNLAGQTGIRVDPAWATQTEIVRGMAQFMPPDHILRERDLQDELDFLARRAGMEPVEIIHPEESWPVALNDIYDADVEAAVKAAYQRDYMIFGFGPWRP